MITAWNDLMYSIIRQNQNVILNRIRQKQDVDEYDWLIQTVACQPWPADFQGRYRLFFVMGRVSASYYTPYFQALGRPVPRRQIWASCARRSARSQRERRKTANRRFRRYNSLTQASCAIWLAQSCQSMTPAWRASTCFRSHLLTGRSRPESLHTSHSMTS